MDQDRPHKAHRTAQSGGKAEKKAKAKGKEKQHGFNEKVRFYSHASHVRVLICYISRRLLQNLVGEPTGKVAGMPRETKPACMSLS
jgi:hypothetical protein